MQAVSPGRQPRDPPESGEAGGRPPSESPESLLVLGAVWGGAAGGQGRHRHRDCPPPRGQPQEELREGTQRAGGRTEDPHRAQAAGGRESLREAELRQEPQHLRGPTQRIHRGQATPRQPRSRPGQPRPEAPGGRGGRGRHQAEVTCRCQKGESRHHRISQRKCVF